MNFLTRGIALLFADFLSLLTIGLCIIQIIPQIRTLYQMKSAKGISPTSLYLNLLSYSIMMSYNYRKGYSMLSYLEYPILLVQLYVLIALVLTYKRQMTKEAGFIALGYFFTFALLLTGLIPTFLLGMMVPLCTPIGATSKIMQLVAILRSKDSSSVNLTTWFISAFTNLTRIYTIMVETMDFMLLCNFGISFGLSTAVYLAAYFYKKPIKYTTIKQND